MTSVGVPLPRDCEQFGVIEHIMQINFQAPRFEIDELTEISVENQCLLFEKFLETVQYPNLVDVFIPLNSLQQPLSDLLKWGIRVNPRTGLRFKVGKMNIEEEKDVHEYVHAAVALGNVMNNDQSEQIQHSIDFSTENINSGLLFDGFHTLCISENHEFVIFNQNQLNTLHLIKFKGGKNIMPMSEHFHVCAICKKAEATIWCQNDKAALCEKCDKSSHSANQLMANHSRMPLFEGLLKNQECPIHPAVKVEYYCHQCHLPVCLECKVKGSHSQGDESKHMLVDFASVYKELVEEVSKPNELMNKVEALLMDTRSQQETKIQELLTNQAFVENKIHDIESNVTQAIHQHYIEQALIIRSVKAELERKLEELQNHKKLIQYHKDQSEPLSFLTSYYNYLESLNEMSPCSDLPVAIQDVQKTLIINNTLSVQGSNITLLPHNIHATQYEEEEYDEEEEYHTNPEPPAQEMHVSIQEEPQPVESEVVTPPQRPKPKITSITRASKRKLKQLPQSNNPLSFQPFEGSSILSDSEVSRQLYLCFPFKNTPTTRLLFSTENDGRSIKRMHKRIDGKGITAVLVKSGEKVFGGLASNKWNTTGEPFGKGNSCMLFSITNDALVPYQPQIENPICLVATPDSISFGNCDLKLADDFDECTSVIENSYGVGFEHDGEEAQTFMAGKPTFRADIVEVWGFFVPN